MTHNIINNKYTIYSDNGQILLNLELTDEPGNQIILSTNKEVFAGPVDLLTFSLAPDKKI